MTPRLPRLAVLLLAIVAACLPLLPIAIGRLAAAPPDRVFVGFPYLPTDHAQYAAFVRQARDCADLGMSNPFTCEAQDGRYVSLYQWTIGRACRATGLSILSAWRALAVLGGMAFVLVGFSVSAAFLSSTRDRALATALLTLGGGLAFMARGAAELTPALTLLTEPFRWPWSWSGFFTLLMPNWVWPELLLVGACVLLVGRMRLGPACAGALLVLVWFLHPYTAVVGYATWALYPVVTMLAASSRAGGRREGLDALARVAPGLLSSLAVGACLAWARRDPVFRATTETGFTFTQHYALWWYPLAYGLLLPFAWRGARAGLRENARGTRLALAWLASAALLSLDPFHSGVKFQHLVFPPLALLAARGFVAWRDERSRARAARVLALVLLFADAPVSMLLWLGTLPDEPKAYVSASEMDALRWLDAQPDGVVLATYFTGTRVPWLSGKHTFVGHWFLTPDCDAKAQRAARFFRRDVPADEKVALLRECGARWVVEADAERRLGGVCPDLPLRRVHESGGAAVYEVVLPPGA